VVRLEVGILSGGGDRSMMKLVSPSHPLEKTGKSAIMTVSR
jgi:hypothetical protein